MAGHGGERRDAGRRPLFKNEWEELICLLLVEEQYADLQSAHNQERQQRSLEKDPFETERTQNVARLRAELHKMPRSKRERIFDAVKRGVPVKKITEARDWHDIQQDLPVCRVTGHKRL